LNRSTFGDISRAHTLLTRTAAVLYLATSRQVFKSGGQYLRTNCPACGREVETSNREQAGVILEVKDQELDEFIAAGSVHAVEAASGSDSVCKDSLF
jgi:hypothetical protein